MDYYYSCIKCVKGVVYNGGKEKIVLSFMLSKDLLPIVITVSARLLMVPEKGNKL